MDTDPDERTDIVADIAHTDARCAACDLRPFPYRKCRANPVNAPTGFVIVIGIPTNECALLNGFATITGHGHISESGETKQAQTASHTGP